MEISQILYVVIIMTAVDSLIQKFAPHKESDGLFLGYIRTFTRCLVLFLIAYIYVVNIPTPSA